MIASFNVSCNVCCRVASIIVINKQAANQPRIADGVMRRAKGSLGDEAGAAR